MLTDSSISTASSPCRMKKELSATYTPSSLHLRQGVHVKALAPLLSSEEEEAAAGLNKGAASGTASPTFSFTNTKNKADF